MIRLGLCVTLLVSTSCAAVPETVDLETAEQCSPTYLQVGEGPLVTSGDSAWRFTFSVALIGCDGELSSIAPEALTKIRNELLHPQKWTLIEMVGRAGEEEFRQRVADRLNSLIGTESVGDVMFFSVGYVDHNAPLS